MAKVPIILNPGVTVQETQFLNKTRWSLSSLIRFFGGYLQKRGGWAKFASAQFSGKCRGLIGWRDLAGNFYLGVGTNSRLQLYTVDNNYDITPLRRTVGIMNPLTTGAASMSVTVHDPGHSATAGDGIFMVTPAAIDGVILYGFYEIASITDGDHYVITIASPALAGVSNGGTTAAFTTSNASSSVSVALARHGQTLGSIYTVHVSTDVGGITLIGDYEVASVTDVNTFVITAGANATSADTKSENGGSVRITYLFEPGGEDAAPAEGYGVSGYGEGEYGYGSQGSFFDPPRQWSMEAWGEDLLAVPTNEGLYAWISSSGLFNNPATRVASAPDQITAMFLTMPQRQIMLLGAEDNGVQDKLLIKWSDIDDYSIYRTVGSPAVPGQQAGWFRLPRGNAIIGGLQVPSQAGLIWTDIALWSAYYIGAPFIYSFTEIASGCGLIAQRAAGVLGGITMWLSRAGYFIYDGTSVRPIPCDVWDLIFGNLNEEQIQKITCAPNSLFREFEWFIPSADGDGENDISIKYSLDGYWDYSPMNKLRRTAWIDQSVWGNPIGAGVDGYLYQHEIGFNDDQAAMDSYAESGWFALDEGEEFVFLERLLPDFVFKGSGATVKMTVKMKEFPADESADNPVQTLGPYSVNSKSTYAIVRGRNRLASLRFESDDLGSFWRLGRVLANMWSDGKR